MIRAPFKFHCAWSWHSRPSAVRYVGTKDQTYWTAISTNGYLYLFSYNHATGEEQYKALGNPGADDHNNGSIHICSDGKILVAWAGHNSASIFYRKTANAEDITSLGTAYSVSTKGTYSYAQLVNLSSEGMLLLFTRRPWISSDGGSGSGVTTTERVWDILISTDDGGSFAHHSVPLWFDEDGSVASPYTEVWGNGVDEIYFARSNALTAFVDRKDILFAKYVSGAEGTAGSFYKADDTKICDWADLPIMASADLELVWDSSAEGDEKTYAKDIIVDATTGDIAIAFTTMSSGEVNTYRYARWTGAAWNKNAIVEAGYDFCEVTAQPSYEGGIVINPADIDEVVISRETSTGSGHWEIERYATANDGDTWTKTEDITSADTLLPDKVVRPLIPINFSSELPVLWMGGGYADFDDYETFIYTVIPTKAPENFNRDANCVAYYAFESGVLTKDSVGFNTLTDNGTVNESTGAGDFKEGSCSASCVAAQTEYFSIADASLDPGFPLKNGDVTKLFSFCGWVRFTSHANYRTVLGKWGAVAGTRSLLLRTDSAGTLTLYTGYSSGASTQSVPFGTNLATGVWYHIGLTLNANTNAYHLRIWDTSANDGAGGILGTDLDDAFANAINIEGAPLQIGAQDGTNTFNGLFDQFVFFNDILTTEDIDAIRADTYFLGEGGETEFWKSLSDWAAGIDSIPALTNSLSTGDTGAGEEAFSGANDFTLLESGSGVDSAGATIALTVSEQGVGADAIAQLISSIGVLDQALGSDAIPILLSALSVLESGIGTDAISTLKYILKQVADSAIGTDTVSSVTAALAVLDQATGEDAIARLLNAVAVLDSATGSDLIDVISESIKLIQDSGTGTDALTSLAAMIAIAEQANGAEILSSLAALTVLDQATGADVISALKTYLAQVHDGATGTDSTPLTISVSVPVSDIGAGAELIAQVMVSLSMSDFCDANDVALKFIQLPDGAYLIKFTVKANTTRFDAKAKSCRFDAKAKPFRFDT